MGGVISGQEMSKNHPSILTGSALSMIGNIYIDLNES